jgi:spore coat protein SA
VRILIVAPEAYPVPSAKGTSVETCIFNIAVNLARHHSVTVVSRGWKYLPQISVWGNLRIIRVPARNQKEYIRAALRSIGRQRFDHLQVDNRPGFLAAVRRRFPNTPLSLFLHSLTFITPPKTTISRARRQLAYADLIVVNSFSLASKVRELYPARSLKLEVVHLGVDSSRFRPPTGRERERIRQRLGLKQSFVIAYAGRFTPLKGIPVLIRAAEQVRRHVPNAELLLAGGGRRRYVSYIRSLGSNARIPIRFLGQVPRKKMPLVYWAADCFVCPSQGHEAFGLVVIEAMASGVPTVASANGGVREIIAHGVNGLLVERYRDPGCFAKTMISIARDSALAKRLGVQGRVTCQSRFNWQTTANHLHALYSGGA